MYHLCKGGGNVEDGALAVGGQADALDLLHSLVRQVAPERGEHKARPLNLLAGVKLQRCVVLVRRQQRARLQRTAQWAQPIGRHDIAVQEPLGLL